MAEEPEKLGVTGEIQNSEKYEKPADDMPTPTPCLLGTVVVSASWVERPQTRTVGTEAVREIKTL